MIIIMTMIMMMMIISVVLGRFCVVILQSEMGHSKDDESYHFSTSTKPFSAFLQSQTGLFSEASQFESQSQFYAVIFVPSMPTTTGITSTSLYPHKHIISNFKSW